MKILFYYVFSEMWGPCSKLILYIKDALWIYNGSKFMLSKFPSPCNFSSQFMKCVSLCLDNLCISFGFNMYYRSLKFVKLMIVIALSTCF